MNIIIRALQFYISKLEQERFHAEAEYNGKECERLNKEIALAKEVIGVITK